MKGKETIHPCAEEVITRFSDMVFRVALSRTGNYNDAEDITQEVFLIYIQKKKEYKGWEHLKAWLLRVTENLSKNLVTSAWRRHTAPLEEGSGTQTTMPEPNDLLEAVQKLPVQYREIMRLHYFKGYRVEEISRRLGMKESTVKTRLSRGRKRLREILSIFVVCILLGALGISLFRNSDREMPGRQEIPDMAGIITGSSAWMDLEPSEIREKMQDDSTIVEHSRYPDFRECRKLSRSEIRKLCDRLAETGRTGEDDLSGKSVSYYRIIDEAGEKIILRLWE